MIRYRERPAPSPLAVHVECAWQGSVPAGAGPHTQRVLPDGCMDLIWTGAELLVAGPDSRAFTGTQAAGTTTCGVRLHPGVAPGLLGVPAAELRDQRVPLAELDAVAARRAVARIQAGAPAVDTLLGLVTGFAARTEPVFRGIDRLAALLGAGASVAAAGDELGWSTRSLHRRCHIAYGYGPATLRRILRFRRAVNLAYAGVPAADAAARAGYADQAHLSREVRALAGVPLGQLLAEAGVVAGANRSTPLPSGSRSTA
ncbi:DUF6597 domain-containing transcriptional factor [Pseudonocardia sp. H11422]|uniref:DUF6597 domain-containing transcriptional factor n=1 Tax=Pseudonocardia sp. H11422 TaxID=2835866 RepID=UPI0027E26DDA|nr:DUF6597 domain-containing transcriptional factor [Pseudonocardia sp. H11422]